LDAWKEENNRGEVRYMGGTRSDRQTDKHDLGYQAQSIESKQVVSNESVFETTNFCYQI